MLEKYFILLLLYVLYTVSWNKTVLNRESQLLTDKTSETSSLRYFFLISTILGLKLQFVIVVLSVVCIVLT